MAEIRVRIQESARDASTFPREVVFDDSAVAGQGMVGTVYRNVDGSYVVKVPSSPVGLAEFRAEYDTLQQLWQSSGHGNPVPLPEIAWGTREDTGGEVLVMPLYRATLSDHIQSLIDGNNRVDAEREAVRAALDFAHVMDVLRRSLEKTCTDRKLKDFFLYDEHLVIIDWNVLNPATPDFFAAELQVFGQLWHQLFLQRIGTPPFDPYNDQRWVLRGQDLKDPANAMPSIGLRAILAAAVHPDVNQRYVKEGVPSHAALYYALGRWERLLNTDTMQLETGRQAVLDDLRTLLPSPEALSSEQCRAIWADLVWRKSGFGADQAAIRGESMRAFAARDFDDPLSRDIIDRLESGDIEAALNHIAGQRSAANLITQQAFGRWETALNGLLAAREGFQRLGASRSQRFLRDLQNDLLHIMAGLVRSPREDATPQLDDMYQRLDKILQDIDQDLGERLEAESIRANWQVLAHEIDLRRIALDYRQAGWQLTRRYAEWQKAEQLLPYIPYLAIADDSELSEPSLLQDIFEDLPVAVLLNTLAASDDPAQMEDACYMVLALSSESAYGWLRDALAPVVNALTFLRHAPGEMPVQYVVQHARDLRQSLLDKALADESSGVIRQLEWTAVQAVSDAVQVIHAAVEIPRIAAVRDAKSTADGLKGVLPDVKWLEQRIGIEAIPQTSDEVRDTLIQYGERFDHYHDWLNLARQHGIDRATHHWILDEPLSSFMMLMGLIKRADELEWDMSDLMGDEAAIRQLVADLRHVADQLTQQAESGLDEVRNHLAQYDEEVSRLQESITYLQQQGSVGSGGRSAAQDVDFITRVAQGVTRDAFRPLEKRLDELSQRSGGTDDTVINLKTTLSGADRRLADLLTQQHEISKGLATVEDSFVALVSDESALLLKLISDFRRLEFNDDAGRMAVLEELNLIARTSSVPGFGGVWSEWEALVRRLVGQLRAFQRLEAQDQKMRKKQSGGTEPLPSAEPFEDLLRRLASQDSSLRTLGYWYVFAREKFEKTQSNASSTIQSSSDPTRRFGSDL